MFLIWLCGFQLKAARQNSLPGGIRVLEPPDPISNSEVKRYIADGSVGIPHVRVGHCQALNTKPSIRKSVEGFFMQYKNVIGRSVKYR